MDQDFEMALARLKCKVQSDYDPIDIANRAAALLSHYSAVFSAQSREKLMCLVKMDQGPAYVLTQMHAEQLLNQIELIQSFTEI